MVSAGTERTSSKKVSTYIHAKSSKCTPNLLRNWASKRAEYSRFRCRKVIQHCGKLSSTSFSWADFWFYWHHKTVPHKNNKGKIYLFAKRSSSSEILKQFTLQSSVPWKTCPVRREKNLSSVLSLTQEALLLLGCRSQREALSKPFIHIGMFSQFFSREARVGKKKQCEHGNLLWALLLLQEPAPHTCCHDYLGTGWCMSYKHTSARCWDEFSLWDAGKAERWQLRD